MKLKNGIKVDYFWTNKFKNNTIVIDFITNLKFEDFAKRAILADIMDNSNLTYPKKSLLAKKLSAMYGANFAVTVLKNSNNHILRVIINFVNEEFLLEKKSLFLEVINFLKEVLYNPLIEEQGFDHKIFNLQKDNLVDYLISLKDNPRFYANTELKKLYYENNPQNAKLIIGNENDYQKLNRIDVYKYYQKMIYQDDIEIKLLGDFDNIDFIQEFNDLFEYRKTNKKRLEWHNSFSKHDLVEITENYQGQGSILGLAYYLPFKKTVKSYFITLILNGLLTINNHSLLFDEIREKNSFAYYINSNYSIFDEMLTIQTGIDANDKTEVINLVNLQFDRIIQMNYSNELLKNVKLTLTDDLLTRFDSQRGIISEMTLVNFFDLKLENPDKIKLINEISKKDIADFFKSVQIQATYLLVGDNND